MPSNSGLQRTALVALVGFGVYPSFMVPVFRPGFGLPAPSLKPSVRRRRCYPCRLQPTCASFPSFNQHRRSECEESQALAASS